MAIIARSKRDLALTRALAILPIELPFIALNYGFVVKRGRMLSAAANAFMDPVRAAELEIP
jgi:hypothetical protein